MSRQNPGRPTEPAGDNSATRTLGFHFKIVPKSSAFRVAASSLVPFELMASLPSTLVGPSHTHVGAGVPSAVAIEPRPAASSANFNDRLLGRVSDASATSKLHAFGPLPRTPIEPRASREAPGGGFQLSKPNVYLPARQMRDYSPRPRAHPLPTVLTTNLIVPLIVSSLLSPKSIKTRTLLALGLRLWCLQAPQAEAPRAPRALNALNRASTQFALKSATLTLFFEPNSATSSWSATSFSL